MRRCVFLAVLLSLMLSLLKVTSGVLEEEEIGSGSGTTPANPETTVLPTSKPPGDFCSQDPCGTNFATCVSLNSSYVCQCPYGFYFSDKNCYKGEVYPCFISVRANYNDNVQNVNSMEYEEVFNNLSEFFKGAFVDFKDYVAQPVIVEIEPITKTRDAPQMKVKMMNLFKTKQQQNLVSSAILKAINEEAENPSYVSLYEVAKQCDVFKCDEQTTTCEGETFPECKCKIGLEKTAWDDRSCSVCSKDCSAEVHKYCVNEIGFPKCKCMPNFQDKDGECVECPVGYSGENCKDNSELILIIVGTVSGAIILSLVIAISVVSARAKHKQNPEKKNLIKSGGYSNTSISDDRPSGMFPRVQTTSGHANPGYDPNNPYDMDSTSKHRFSKRNYDDLYEASREQRGFRMQSRY